VRDSYWAAAPAGQIGEKLFTRVQNYDSKAVPDGMFERYARAYQYYFGLSPSGVHSTSQVLRGGDIGELAEVRVNHARPLVNTLLNLITAPKVAWTPKAVNIDYESLKECKLAQAVLEYYWLEREIQRTCVSALEEALVFSEGFQFLEWDSYGGDEVGTDLEATEVIKSGDICVRNVSSWDVIRDAGKTSWDALDWVIVRVRKNKWDLIAQYDPEFLKEDGKSNGLGDRILSAETGSEFSWKRSEPTEDEDDVACYYFFHKRNAVMPQGRQTVFLSTDAVLADGKLEWDEIPLYRVSAGEMTGTPYGYTPFLDILGVQELMDSLNTAVASNQSTFAHQMIYVEEGTDISPENFGGAKLMYGKPGAAKPEALQLTRTPSEVFQYLGMLQKQQELLIGLNSVVRGEPQSGDQSGSALAHLSSQALQQASNVQAAYLRMVQSLGNGILCAIRRRLSAEKQIGLVGKTNAFLVDTATYSGKSFDRIKRVQVEIGNPLAQTTSGRDMIAKDYINLGLVKTPEQLQQLHETGKLEPLTQGLSHQLMLIRSENEQMASAVMDPMTGELDEDSQPPVLALDDHRLHAREHAALLSSPQVRKNQAVVRAVLRHIEEHERLLTSVPPMTLLMVGQEPPPMPMGPPPPGGPDAGPPPGAEGPPGPPDAAAQATKPPGNPQAGKLPNLPSPPKNPATGQPYDPKAGAPQQ
jgi:hypothetical protein